MEFAYDHIQEEILSSNSNNKTGDSSTNNDTNNNPRPSIDLSAEFQETLRAFSASPWGARIGGFWDNVRKHGESYYAEARQEYAAASEEAARGLSDLRNSIVGHTRGLSMGVGKVLGGGNNNSKESGDKDTDKDGEKEKDDGAATPTSTSKGVDAGEKEKEKGGDDGESFISRFRAEAARRLKDIERAEDAADEALIRFGTNIRNFLRDAVSIAAPEDNNKTGTGSSTVLFDSKDNPDGSSSGSKRVIHATRFEAQLHAIHSNLDSFTKDPDSPEWPAFRKEFNVDHKTFGISTDLEMYPELRRAMEKLVPEKVEYADFWARYYFLRLVIETEEKKRRELLKGASNPDEEEVAWDEDSDSDSDESPSTPQVKSSSKQDVASSSTSQVDPGKDTNNNNSSSSSRNLLKPGEPRRSNDQQSQPDSESSYDLVSGATSRTLGSPKEKSPPNTTKADESDDDWE
ncbi:BSD domain protein [Thermoascus aurantiacus ATCC 26904]